jgi:hypothetical protein
MKFSGKFEFDEKNCKFAVQDDGSKSISENHFFQMTTFIRQDGFRSQSPTAELPGFSMPAVSEDRHQSGDILFWNGGSHVTAFDR